MADTQRLLSNGPLTNGQPKRPNEGKIDDDLEHWNKNLKVGSKYSQFHGDLLLADKHRKQTGLLNDISRLLTLKNLPDILRVASVALRGKGLDVRITLVLTIIALTQCRIESGRCTSYCFAVER